MAGPARSTRSNRRRLPGLDVPVVQDQELRRFLESVSEHFGTYEGDRNAPKERFVTIDDLERAGLITTKVRAGFAEIQSADSTSAGTGTGGSSNNFFDGLDDVNVAAAAPDWMLKFDGAEWIAFDFDTESRSIEAPWLFSDEVTFDEDLLLGPGKSLFFFDVTEADMLELYHDGTDFNADFTGTTDWNITGLSSIQAGTADADFDAVTATSFGGILEANLLDKSATEEVPGGWTFSGTLVIPEAAVTDHEAALSIAGEQIDSGTIADARLSSNVPLLNAANIFTANQTISGAQPVFFLSETDQAADSGLWRHVLNASTYQLDTRNDANSAGNTALRILRTGIVVDEVELNATLLDFNGNVDISGTLAWGGGASIGDSDQVALVGDNVSIFVNDAGYLTVVTAADVDSGAATDGFVLTADGAGGAAWEAPTGGSGSPGGSDTQVQYNNAGAFGGFAGVTHDSGDMRFADNVGLIFGAGGDADIYSDGTDLRIDTAALVYIGSNNWLSPNNAVLNRQSAAGNSVLDINSFPNDGVSGAFVRLFRSTNTTGVSSFNVMRGNNTTSSFFTAQYDNTGLDATITINAPDAVTLSLTGATNTLSGSNALAVSGFSGVTFSTDVTISNPSTLSFGAAARQMLNLFNDTYGIGVESSTLYYRALGGQFRWYTGAADGGTSDIAELTSTLFTIGTAAAPIPIQFGTTPIRLRAGVNVPTAMSVRADTNPSNDQAIFAVESSGSATRFFVTQGEGSWARDGFAVGTDDDGDVGSISTATSWLNASGSLYLGEQSSAPADTAAKGQFWVINTTPNRPYFTDDSGIDLPFFGLTQNIQNVNYTLTLSDIGRYISKTSGGSGETITIPANASTAFPVGTVIPVENRGGGNLSIAITTDTLLWPAGSGTGTRTLANDCACCLFKAGTTTWYIFGAGVS